MVIPDHCLKDVIDIINEEKGSGFSFYTVLGRGSTKDNITKVKFEVVVKEGREQDIIRKAKERIGNHIQTGGMIFVSDISNAVDLVSAKEGEGAIEKKRHGSIISNP